MGFPGEPRAIARYRKARLLEEKRKEIIWWTWPGSNRRPLPCHGSALPAAPQAHAFDSWAAGPRFGFVGHRPTVDHWVHARGACCSIFAPAVELVNAAGEARAAWWN